MRCRGPLGLESEPRVKGETIGAGRIGFGRGVIEFLSEHQIAAELTAPMQYVTQEAKPLGKK